MECNKEEAVRAKEIAEKKMADKDFAGARKVALKAQQLYPELENISQMIMVCDVHCSAENKVYGNENDWYSIFKIEPTSDELSIKKQYRKFALLLHPDKNKFAGSADAFKLIGEAQRVLLDREKRIVHDSKRKAAKTAAPNWAPQQPSRHSDVGNYQPWTQNNFMAGHSVNSQCPQQQAQTGLHANRPIFWTVCPFCSVRYQFYKEVMNKLLWCQSCKRSFTGYEVNTQGGTPSINRNQPSFPQQNQVPFKGSPRSTSLNFTSKAGFQGRHPFTQTGFSSEVCEGSKLDENSANVYMKTTKDGQSKERESHGKANGRNRRKQVEESSESCDSESSTGSEEDIVVERHGKQTAGQDFQYYGEHPRRSSRCKRNISYSENLSDDDVNPSKRGKSGGSSSHATKQEVEYPLAKGEVRKMDKKPPGLVADMEVDKKELKQEKSYDANSQKGGGKTEKEDGKESLAKDGEISCEEIEPEIYECPDPDFSDFDKDRKEECFEAGQIWAVYDTRDAMPRFYCRIEKVLSTGFKLQITWLELDTFDEDEIKWFNEDLPVSFGKFRGGKPVNTGDHPMFSHLVSWEKTSHRDAYKIYPRKGETWALFKNWDVKWYSSNPDDKTKYEYEFLEILTDYDDSIGVYVAYLRKVKGFTCLFCRSMEDGMISSVLVTPNEKLRFSHRVPSFRMAGEEREGVPKGSFELDPASLPPLSRDSSRATRQEVEGPAPKEELYKIEKKPTDMEVNKKELNQEANWQNGGGETEKEDEKEDLTTDGEISSEEVEPEVYVYPDPDFSDFDKDRKEECFEARQIWAVYDTQDAMPRFYAWIRKVLSPRFKLQITWLEADPDNEDEIRWVNEDLPVSCGNFKHGNSDKAEDLPMFSHLVDTWDKGSRRDTYKIYPKKGETWALFKNWDIKWCSSNPDAKRKYEYEFVEILTDYDESISLRVVYLDKVKGFTCLFSQRMDNGLVSAVLVPPKEKFRFSHRIPSFRMTGEEREGVPKGSFELDPACLPTNI